jgi:hypothetical protein
LERDGRAIASPGSAVDILEYAHTEIVRALFVWRFVTSTVVRDDRRYDVLDVQTPYAHGFEVPGRQEAEVVGHQYSRPR